MILLLRRGWIESPHSLFSRLPVYFFARSAFSRTWTSFPREFKVVSQISKICQILDKFSMMDPFSWEVPQISHNSRTSHVSCQIQNPNNKHTPHSHIYEMERADIYSSQTATLLGWHQLLSHVLRFIIRAKPNSICFHCISFVFFYIPTTASNTLNRNLC